MMKELIAKIEEAERLYEESDRLMEIDEPESDRLYAEAYRLTDEAGAEIHRMSGGQVNYQCACQMVRHHKDELLAILTKAV